MSYSNAQLRGMILEELILYLLRRSGYQPLTVVPADHTIRQGAAGLEMRGRGAWHQLDAVADYRVTPPFAHPIRLLIEGKYLSEKVGLPIVRNACSVHRDLSENWVVDPAVKDLPPSRRFHYLLSVFSATDFTQPAEHFAYAHDIYLVPLQRSAFLRPVLDRIGRVNAPEHGEPAITELRIRLRESLLFGEDPTGRPAYWSSIQDVIGEARNLQYGLIAMFGNRFPVFLVARPRTTIQDLPPVVDIRIHWRNGEWFIVEANTLTQIFSFDLPDELFRLYASSGRLTSQAVAELKLAHMREFVAYFVEADGALRLYQFRLDPGWAMEIAARLNNAQPR
jgi:hypothetical protein